MVLHGKPIAVEDDGTCEVQDEQQLAWLRAQPRHWVDLKSSAEPEDKQELQEPERAEIPFGGYKHGRKGKHRR